MLGQGAADGVDHLREPASQLPLGCRLHPADGRVSQGMTCGLVADAGDLALVGHQPGELGPRPLGDLRRHLRRAPRLVDRRALRADARHPPAQRPPARVDVEADANTGGAGADRALDQVEVGAVVDHQHRAAARVLRGQPRHLRDRAAVDRGVGDDDVLEAGACEVNCLGSGEGEDAMKARDRARGFAAARRSSAPTSTRCESAGHSAWASIACALACIASRSTNANGGVTPVKIAS